MHNRRISMSYCPHTKSFLKSEVIDNDYIPISGIFRMRSDSNIYDLRMNESTHQATSVANLLDSFIRDTSFNRAGKTLVKDGVTYYAQYGTLFYTDENGNIKLLMSLCIKYTYFNDSVITVISSGGDVTPEITCLVIDNSIYKEQHKSILRAAEKKIVELAAEMDIDIIYVNNLIKKCYNTTKILFPELNTFEEELEYLSQVGSQVDLSFLTVE